MSESTTRVWFQIFLFSPNISGKFPFWLIFFQLGWNQQLEKEFEQIESDAPWPRSCETSLWIDPVTWADGWYTWIVKRHLNPPFFVVSFLKHFPKFLLQNPIKQPNMLVMLLLRLEKDVNIRLVGSVEVWNGLKWYFSVVIIRYQHIKLQLQHPFSLTFPCLCLQAIHQSGLWSQNEASSRHNELFRVGSKNTGFRLTSLLQENYTWNRLNTWANTGHYI